MTNHIIEAGKATRFGTGAHRVCCARAKSTGLQCQNPALTETTVCRMHGGKAVRARRMRLEGKPLPVDQSKGFLCSLPFTEASRAYLQEHPSTARQMMTIRSLRERGKFILEAMNRELNHNI